MKVLFLLSDYPLHNSLLSEYAAARPEDELAVIKIPLVIKGKGRRGSAQRILPQLSRRFVAAKLLEYVALMGITAIPKILGRGAIFRRLRRSCRQLKIPFHRTSNVMDPGSLTYAQEFNPDVVISLCHQILKEPLISLPRLGVVNLHPGLLPDFRGIQPYFWELSEGSDRCGATLHLIENEEIDTGGILGTASFQVIPAMSVQLNYFLTIRCASGLLPDCIAGLESGKLRPRGQADQEGCYYRWPDSEAFDRLVLRGHSVISLRQLLSILTGSYDSFLPDHHELSGQTE
jgi:methionyl-tRNA formyltransferase